MNDLFFFFFKTKRVGVLKILYDKEFESRYFKKSSVYKIVKYFVTRKLIVKPFTTRLNFVKKKETERNSLLYYF